MVETLRDNIAIKNNTVFNSLSKSSHCRIRLLCICIKKRWIGFQCSKGRTRPSSPRW